MGTQPGSRSSCFSSYLPTLQEPVPDGVGGTPGRESGGLGFRPIWGPTALYNLDLRGVPVGQVRNYQRGSKGPSRSRMHSFNRYFLSSYYVPRTGLGPGDIAMNQEGKSLPLWCCQRREGRPILSSRHDKCLIVLSAMMEINSRMSWRVGGLVRAS